MSTLSVFSDNTVSAITLEDILKRREMRQYQQQALLKSSKGILLSFTLNIPGPIKTSVILRQLFSSAVHDIQSTLNDKKITILNELNIQEKTGDEYMALLQCDAKTIKKLMCHIEETHPCGRLFDIDILDENGNKISRSTYRTCLVCQNQAQNCARNQTHNLSELYRIIELLITNYMQHIQ